MTDAAVEREEEEVVEVEEYPDYATEYRNLDVCAPHPKNLASWTYQH